MTILILLLIGLLVISLIMLENEIGLELFKFSLTGFLICFIIEIINVDKPSAMDVYRGKTILEVTYKDSVAIDSVVVFKKNNENNEKLHRHSTE